MTKVLVYFDGGATYKGCREHTRAATDALKREAKSKGQAGYLHGIRIFDGQVERVYCFFKQEPAHDEIARRRANGFIQARWREL